MSDADFKLILVGLVQVVGKGPEGLPSGVLYAELMSHGASLDQHNMVVGTLKHSGLITEESHLLKATPKGKAEAAVAVRALLD